MKRTGINRRRLVVFMGRQCIKKLFDSTPLGQQLLSAAEVEREAIRH